MSNTTELRYSMPRYSIKESCEANTYTILDNNLHIWLCAVRVNGRLCEIEQLAVLNFIVNGLNASAEKLNGN